MMKHNYLGYWWLNGEKAYMVYAANGGDSYVEENAYDIGLTDSKWNALGCSSPSPPEECNVPMPEQAIEQMHAEIMDGAADNGSMRENIVGAGHRKVSIGVAWNGRRVVLVQHFEGGDVVVHDRSLLFRDGRRYLSVTLRKIDASVASTARCTSTVTRSRSPCHRRGSTHLAGTASEAARRRRARIRSFAFSRPAHPTLANRQMW